MLLLSGCGQTGNLVLPERKPPPARAAASSVPAPAVQSDPEADRDEQRKKDAVTP